MLKAENEPPGRRPVVVAVREGDEVGGGAEGDVVAGGKADVQAAFGALLVVNLEDLATEGGRVAGFEGLVRDEKC